MSHLVVNGTMGFVISNLSLAAIVLVGIVALSNPSIAGFVDMIGDEFGDLIEQDSQDSGQSPLSESKLATGTKSTKDQKHSDSGSSSNSKQVSTSSETQLPSGTEEKAAISKPAENDLYTLMKRYITYYNNGIDEVPDLVKKVAGNDVILLEIAMNDNTDLKIKAVTKDGLVTEFKKVTSTSGIDPSVSVLADEDSIRALLSSGDAMGQLSSSLNSGDIEIECKGFLKKAAVSALKSIG
ncbi:hypothetical protein V7O66_04675 [Methanolobus sp. ZRKC3]|uniref:hypothetical protein n=1 Tax=Methanolobus sp. ZRKC3 TaxID=3125786 RepID=UPI00324914F4